MNRNKRMAYQAPDVEVCTISSSMICATSTSSFGDGGSIGGGWDGEGVGTTPFTPGGVL